MGVPKHRMTGTRLYKIWDGMKYRCYKEDSTHYHNYGGRGISVCDEWREDFMNFYNWAMENGYEEELQIDRIDNDGNYEPSNCRWATRKEQGNNRRTCVYITIDKETKTAIQWAEENDIHVSTLLNRYHNGIEGLALLEKPKDKNPAEKQVHIEGLTWSKDKKKWRLRLRLEKNKLKHFGYFDNLEDAIEERDKIINKFNLKMYLHK
ncbi:hypothetical protein [uncultured Metabacillus sp.]|uniref:hypothetical protein n=1 Tax=uncultured Metabacillus sp. TaxID=2860135 RepID=UPI00260A21D5|nr:hypothetical protein [uncultured Metabacillus sp.]